MDADNIPIDIHYNKLLDWLVSRRHCDKLWQGEALGVREMINTAIQDMPAVDEITQLLQGTHINYFHCVRICELLKGTEDGSRNIFGRYSSQRMKDWMDILKSYESNSVYLAEAAQMLTRNVNYEIPALKRQIAKCQQTQTDCTRKESEYASSSAEMKEKYHTSCRQLGIQGNKVKAELLDLVQDMPTMYEEITRSLDNTRAGCQYYSEFTEFLLNSSEKGVGCVPLLKYVLAAGNTTTYEYRTGSAPTRIEQPTRDYGDLEEESAAIVLEDGAEIDWGATDTIDFDISVDDAAAEVPDEIDWGDGGTVIELVDDSTTDLAGSADDCVARGTDALTILDNTETRNLLINQLLELQAFLTQRVQELSDDSSVLSGSLFQAAPSGVQIGSDNVQTMLGHVTSVVDNLTSKKMQDLFLIRSSPRYVHRMADSLKKILVDSEKLMSLSRLMVVRRGEAAVEMAQVQPRVDLLRKRTQELRKQIEGEVSKKYKGRRVNIMGEINTV